MRRMLIGVPREEFPGERRVALTPVAVSALSEAGLEVVVESGAGAEAGFSDQAYRERGAHARSREEAFGADVILQVRITGTASHQEASEVHLLRPGQVLVGFANPLGAPQAIRDLAGHGVTAFALELMPRIARAQPMDALSSQATVAGYKAVLLAAQAVPKMFPMLTTSAGTITPARVLVVGAGVAGLQAIATARRLGAVIQAYDVRPAVKEQVESLGAKFVELSPEADDAEADTGYAREMGEEFYRRQAEVMGRVLTATDAVITTALVPGKRAPVLITEEQVAGMAPGSVIVDLAAEQGGNCELTQPDQEVVAHGVIILGPTNLPATVPSDASQMYAKNVSSFLLHLVRDGEIHIDLDDPIHRETLVARDGEVVQARVREALGLSPEQSAASGAAAGSAGAGGRKG